MFGVARVRNDSGSASVKVCGGNPPRQLLDPPFPRFKRRAKTTQDWNRFVGTKDKLEIAVERKVSTNFSLSLSLSSFCLGRHVTSSFPSPQSLESLLESRINISALLNQFGIG